MYRVIAHNASVVLIDRVVPLAGLGRVLLEARARCLHAEVVPADEDDLSRARRLGLDLGLGPNLYSLLSHRHPHRRVPMTLERAFQVNVTTMTHEETTMIEPNQPHSFDDSSILQASRAHRAGGGSLRHRYVLRQVGGYEPWVTHLQCWHEDGRSFFADGRYFRTLRAAAEDFDERTGDLYLRHTGYLESEVTP